MDEVHWSGPTSDLLARLQAEQPGEGLDWRKIREEIHDAYDQAPSLDERCMLIQMFNAVMNLVERQGNLYAEDLEKFRDAPFTDYRLLIVKGSMIGENVSVDLLDTITKREVAAGRMAPNHSLRELAVNGMAAPHLSPDELKALDAEKRAALEINAAIAGRVLAHWLPEGLTRKVILFGLVMLAIFGVYLTQNYLFLIAFGLASAMSPRLVGEFAFALGRINRSWR